MDQEQELSRIKDILFPKKHKKYTTPSAMLESPIQPTQTLPLKETCVKTDIEKLRKEIYNMLSKGKDSEQEGEETERAYLDGIQKIVKGLKDYSN